VKTPVVLISLCLSGAAFSALAADVSIKGTASETLTGSDNLFLSQSPSGPAGETVSALRMDVLAQTPTTQFLLDGNYSYYKYFGPGATDTTLTSGTPANATFSVDHTTELTKYHFSANWSRVDTAQVLLAQGGFFSGRGSATNYSVTGGATHDLSRLDTIGWTATWRTISFTDPTQVPFVDFTTGLNWSRIVTQQTTWLTAVNFDWFSQDNPQNSQRLFWTATTGFQSNLAPRLSVSAHVGVNFVNSYQNGALSPVVLPPVPLVPGVAPFTPQVGAGHGWLADASLNYDLLKTTRLTLTAAHNTTPLLTGQLQTADTVGLGIVHTINHLSSLNFSTQFAQTTSGQLLQSGTSAASGASEFLSASVGYNYELSREWRTNLSYSYLQRNDITGTVHANVVMFGLSRDFNVLGNPTAINLADRERSKQRAQEARGFVFPNLFPNAYTNLY
jgi:hypothetical protein